MTRRSVALGAALLFLNASITFENVWPTPAIAWRGKLSLELAISVLVMALAARGRMLASKTLGWFSAIWTLLVAGRYAEVTAPALYGRDVNLYWDLRFVPDVVAMATRVAPLWLIVVCVAAAGSVLALLYVLVRAASFTIAAAAGDWRQGRLLIVASALVTLAFAGQQVRGRSESGRLNPSSRTSEDHRHMRA